MKKNDIFKVNITGYDHAARGVARVDGMVVFVNGGAVGDECEIRILKVLKNTAFAKIERLIHPSSDRISSDCPAFPACGGCDFRHISYDSECRFKKDTVETAITRIGRITPPEFELVPSPVINRSRNKAVFPVSDSGFGFYREGSHKIVRSDGCLSCAEGGYEAALAVFEFAKAHGIPAYDEVSGKGIIRSVFSRAAADGRLMVMPVVRSASGFPSDEFVSFIRQRLPKAVSILLNVNPSNGNKLLGERCITLYGTPYLEDELCGVRLRLSPLSFYQVNHSACERLYSQVLEYADECSSENDVALDLFCGVGSITLCLASRFRAVAGIEIVPAAIENAKENALLNGIKNASFFCSDAENARSVLTDAGIHPDILVVDPPRKGLGPELIKYIPELGCRNIIYVSCDPATLARDLALLSDSGYALQKLKAFDLFPRTRHVETVVLLGRE